MTTELDLKDFIRYEYQFGKSSLDTFIFFLGANEMVLRDSFRWAMSISDKIGKFQIAYEDFYDQLPSWVEENKTIKEKGYGTIKESVKLALRYENFLNSIYSLCENFSHLIVAFYPGSNLPNGFYKQKKRFLTHDIDARYKEILENTMWYDEVHAYRSEATHFLSGFITISDDGSPGYFNKPLNKRNGAFTVISKEDIETHVKEIYSKV